MAAALIALPTMAQDWQSTSTMQTSGSAYTPQVTPVGATDVSSIATTTDNYSPSNAPGRPRRTPIGGDGEDGWTSRMDTESTGLSPVGDALIPLMLMAIAFCGAIAIRKKRSALNR